MRSVLLIIIFYSIESLDNGLGLTPPMGWNSWNSYGCNISQDIMKQIADKMVSKSLKNAGYSYLNLGDCWQMGRDENHHILPNNVTFSNGIQVVADYVHKKGLKMGIHSGGGKTTCAGKTSSLGFEKLDVQSYEKWGIDYLSYDNCFPILSIQQTSKTMSKALNSTGYAVYFALYGNEYEINQWAVNVANSWLSSANQEMTWSSVLRMLHQQQYLQSYAAPGGWNDPGFLLVGYPTLTYKQQYAQFVLWAILKAPLILSCDLNNINDQTLQMITNQEIININQDLLGIQASLLRKEIYTSGIQQVWGSHLVDNKYIVVFFNQGNANVSMQISVTDQLKIQFESYNIRDPIRHKSMGSSTVSRLLVDNIQSHSVEARILTISSSLTIK